MHVLGLNPWERNRGIPVVALHDEAIHGVAEVKTLPLVGLGQVVGLVFVSIVDVQFELASRLSKIRKPLIPPVDWIWCRVVQCGSTSMPLQVSTDRVWCCHTTHA